MNHAPQPAIGAAVIGPQNKRLLGRWITEIRDVGPTWGTEFADPMTGNPSTALADDVPFLSDLMPRQVIAEQTAHRTGANPAQI